MYEVKKSADDGTDVRIEVTNCPECGTEWEVVVTKRPTSAKPRDRREE